MIGQSTVEARKTQAGSAGVTAFAATRMWPGDARTRARCCVRQPLRSWRRCAGRSRRAGGQHVQGRQALRPHARGAVLGVQAPRGRQSGGGGAGRLYVIGTSLSAAHRSAPEAVRSYKALGEVARAFRTRKTVDLKVRPSTIDSPRRCARTSCCACAPLTSSGICARCGAPCWSPTGTSRPRRRAIRLHRPRAQRKAATHTLEDESQAHSFRTLVDELASIVRNTCRTPGSDGSAPTFQLTTRPNLKQTQALDLIETINA